ncbi:MAG TPA: carbamate kinase [Acidimicrobiales bacterium]|nr:carbamate kinase [Acidimicrobiales bacterium]
MGGRALIALGGNALCGADQTGTYAEQRENARAMAASVGELIDIGWQVVVVHGNGPQVGALGVQQEAAATLVPPQPLFSLSAMTQGYLGSLIALALHERLGRDRQVVSVVTHVVVHGDDPAFAEPSKPIGPFYTATEARRLTAERHWTMAEDAGRGFRRVVPSPEPLGILEVETIGRIVDAGMVVIACGGGGVPVAMSVDGYVGVDAVVDKDLAAQRLGSALGVDALALVTSVPAVQLGHGTPRQHDLHELGVDDAARYLAEGQFAPGSMGPKIAAAIRFIREGGEAVAITTAPLLASTLAVQNGRPAGTLVTASSGRRVSR